MHAAIDNGYILALDQGTTSSRSIVFDLAGHALAQAQQEFTQHYPQPGWVEHEPEVIWGTQLATLREAVRNAGIAPADIRAIGITNQRETTLLWDRRSGQPVARAIVWQDRRSAALCDALKARGLEALFRERTGLLLDPYFSGTKLHWLLANDPDLRRRAEAGELAFGTVDSWLIHRLSGGRDHVTDVSNASRTLLFDIHRLAWDEELLGLLDIPAAVLPEVRPSAGYFATLDPDILGAPIPITGVAGDQQAALFGQACFEPGMAKNTYGTGAFVVMHTGARPVVGEGVLATVAWQLGDAPAEYALEGSIFVAGAAVQWLRDGLGLIPDAARVEELARSVPDNGDVYFVPALTGLGAPFWDPYARGLIVGLTRGTRDAHIARAALEAIAYRTRDAIDTMTHTTGIPLAELRVDGGACVNDWLMQFQADMLGVPVRRPAHTETTARGAAGLAALGAGLADRAQLAQHWLGERNFTPAMPAAERDRLHARWRQAVALSRGWARGQTEG
ncbi:glycerol kinase [Acidihalobacter yilgarnensis]|uniref:Glycerol kinase n=1 Tax=Acidihalobacter yilgarnensis TaxID=2819280 RepID=A0A1D8INA3_9GAMM|nr:glycerol kinase GlpK [Acidihalobacter yilgarnensis]AOU97894.1 glycerol kinase [Acidihalobacter yilgarnensis]